MHHVEIMNEKTVPLADDFDNENHLLDKLLNDTAQPVSQSIPTHESRRNIFVRQNEPPSDLHQHTAGTEPQTKNPAPGNVQRADSATISTPVTGIRDTNYLRTNGDFPYENTKTNTSMRQVRTNNVKGTNQIPPTTPLISNPDDDVFANLGEAPSFIWKATSHVVWIALIIALIWLMVSIAQHLMNPEPIILSSYSQSTNLQSAAKVIGISLPDIPRTDNTQKIAIPAGESSVLGPPTITAKQIDEILRVHGSPATGTGQYWIEAGVEFGIDPVYALAFFMHESNLGTNPNWVGLKPDGSTTHNIGNITCADYPTCLGRFRDYPDWQSGIHDWFRLISVEYVNGWGVATVEGIIPHYAPSSDQNDEPLYIENVKQFVAQWRHP